MVWRLTWELVLFDIFLAALLFWPAGTFDWWGGWVLLGEMAVGGIAICAWLLVCDPELLQERLAGGFQKEQVFSDKILMIFVQIGFLGWIVLMGLDRRWGWSHMPHVWNYAGAVLAATFYLTCWLVFRENSFAAPVVKIQEDRKQHVVTTGPYRFVRHPMYAGGIFFFVGIPLLLGSWPGLLCVPFLIGLLVIRIPIEERTLREHLAGYGEYAAHVRYRLIPGIW